MNFSETILSWWRPAERELPWRETRDPWAVLVSEVMAQQTQVERVVPKWRSFMQTFPTPEAAAAAPLADLLILWTGLGYNRRAKHLHACAGEISSMHDGVVPDSLSELLNLSGVGPYTARAVLAFAFEKDAAVVDTNVGRTLARFFGRSLSASDAQDLADRLLPAGDAWRWNQALLDFGATVCTKRAPRCASCPVQPSCHWAGEGADPAVGSAAVTVAQSRFEGSDRQGRGRLVQALCVGPVSRSEVARVMGWDDDATRARRVLGGLVAEGLVVDDGETVTLP